MSRREPGLFILHQNGKMNFYTYDVDTLVCDNQQQEEYLCQYHCGSRTDDLNILLSRMRPVNIVDALGEDGNGLSASEIAVYVVDPNFKSSNMNV